MRARAGSERLLEARAKSMEAAEMQRVQQSFGRCLHNASKGKSFLDAFYDEFLASDPRIKPHFANTDMQKQKDLLRHGLAMLIMLGTGSPLAQRTVEQLAVKHDRSHLNIAPDLYRFWVKSLLACVRSYDDSYDDAIGDVWSKVLDEGVAVMTKAY
jgi:hemoglobin-like flavoprotein